MGVSHKDHEGWVVAEKKQQTRAPSLYKVLLHNDDYTTMDFVVAVLKTIFHKNLMEANRIMLNVHQKGFGVAGVYSRDVAETKVAMVRGMARENEYPLRCSIEEA